jgi:hypothetical protein
MWCTSQLGWQLALSSWAHEQRLLWSVTLCSAHHAWSRLIAEASCHLGLVLPWLCRLFPSHMHTNIRALGLATRAAL